MSGILIWSGFWWFDLIELIRGKYCNHHYLRNWYTAILQQNYSKERMMLFFHWICETYLVKKQKKKGKRKSVNQYWWNFKMLYYWVNDVSVNINDFNEIIKVCDSSFMLFLYETLILYMKYINNTLKDKFNLNITFKLKPVTESDNLLFLLVKHWAWNAYVFFMKDNWYDLITLLLF